MARRTIPQHEEVTCDCCGKLFDEVDRNAGGRLFTRHNASMVPDEDLEWDLCRKCLSKAESAIRGLQAEHATQASQ